MPLLIASTSSALAAGTGRSATGAGRTTGGGSGAGSARGSGWAADAAAAGAGLGCPLCASLAGPLPSGAQVSPPVSPALPVPGLSAGRLVAELARAPLPARGPPGAGGGCASVIAPSQVFSRAVVMRLFQMSSIN